MGETASARTDRELGILRGAIERDVDALKERIREDMDPRNVLFRQPVAVLGSLGSLATAAAVALMRRGREKRAMDGQVDALVERFGGRIDKLKGDARKRFRKQLRKELAEVDATGPKAVVYGAASALLTALATTVAQTLGRRLLGDDEDGYRRR
ncbi:MAG: hypothetical protein HYX56_02360 [Chloroflexi bacterium]|nr:hypothetical protein [Chloroflexota bacterium]